jgi:hypothetical protein
VTKAPDEPAAFSLANDESLPHDVSFVGQSPHVFAYRMWFRRPDDEEWTEFALGDTDDDVPDHHMTGPHPDGSRIAINVAVGGKPNSTFRFIVSFSQDGGIVQGGTFVEAGRTGDNGGGSCKLGLIFV